MYAPAGLLTRRELLLCEVFLLVIPLAAYPLREIFHIGKDRRRGQRGTALVCSAVGYLCGFLWSMLTPCSWLVHILFLSYVISIAALLLLNAGFGLRASGHACSTTAPAFLLTWKLHPLFVIPSVLLIAAVYRSSLKLSRCAASGRLGGQSAGLCDLDHGLWRQIKRYCAASSFHLTVARRSPVFIAASSIAAVLFCVILILEKRYHNSAGARMGSDHTSYGRIANFFQFSLPDVTAVFDIL